MIAELISVGTELLMGNIVNTHAAYLSEKCAALGISLYNQQVVGDNEGRLSDAIRLAIGRADVVILSGGLGPTQDDLTKEVAAKVMGCGLIEDAGTRERIDSYFRNSGRSIPENNWKQTLIPENSIILENNNGTAPGIIIEKDGKAIIMLPGPPNEMKPMFEESVHPYLIGRKPDVLYSKMVKICGIGESQVETDILDLIEAQTNPTIATYAKTGEVHLRITAKAETLELSKGLVKPVVKMLRDRFGDNIYTTDENETLEDTVVKSMKKKKLQMVTVESCTGGLLAGRLINVSGASQVIQDGFITYSDNSKVKLVGVSKRILEEHGAVSSEVAAEMAICGRNVSGADIGVSITGVAGPDMEDGRPVGLVYIGCSYMEKVIVKEYNFRGNRQKIREQAVIKALDLVRRCLLAE